MVYVTVRTYAIGQDRKIFTRPLMIPLPRDNRADAELEVGLDTSFMPSGPRGIDNLPPILVYV
jgi:hypothetical protein